MLQCPKVFTLHLISTCSSVLQVSVGIELVMGKLNLTGRSHVDATMDVTQTQGNVSMVAPVYKDNLQSMPGQDRPVELVA